MVFAFRFIVVWGVSPTTCGSATRFTGRNPRLLRRAETYRFHFHRQPYCLGIFAIVRDYHLSHRNRLLAAGLLSPIKTLSFSLCRLNAHLPVTLLIPGVFSLRMALLFQVSPKFRRFLRGLPALYLQLLEFLRFRHWHIGIAIYLPVLEDCWHDV